MSFTSLINGDCNISFNQGGTEIVRITIDGDVQWRGKPSAAADVFTKVIANSIDSRVASAGMRQRTYVRACEMILRKAREMTKEELVAFLEESVQNRKNHSVLLALKEDAE